MEELEKQEQPLQTGQQEEVVETEVIHDDENPIEVLKETAKQLGIKDVHLLTEKELRSLIDREVSKAIKTREERLRKEQERKLLEEQGKYEEILKMERKEALEKVKQEFLQITQMEEFADFVDVSQFVNKPLNEGVEELKANLNKLKNFIDSIVEIKLKERIASLQKAPISSSSVSDVKQILTERLKNLG